MKYSKIILLMLVVGVLLDIVIDLLIPDRVMKLVFVISFPVLVLGLLLVVFGTITKNRWGINLQSVNCPVCASPSPRLRQPKSFRQALWGGATCEKCGCEMDKWGRQISPAR